MVSPPFVGSDVLSLVMRKARPGHVCVEFPPLGACFLDGEMADFKFF